MVKFVIKLLVLHVVSTMPLFAQEVNIAAGAFPGLINQEGIGAYQQVLNHAAKRSDIKLTETFYPIKRAVNVFKHKQVLAIYGMIDSVKDEINRNEIITTYPIGIFKLYIFTKKDQPPISSYEQLKGKSIGGIRGYESSYQPLIEKNINIYYISNEASQLARLKSGRVDAILGFLPDWTPYLEQLNYDKGFLIEFGYDYIVAWNTPLGRAFVNKISPTLQQMKIDGTLKKILAERYIDFDYKVTKSFEWSPTKPVKVRP